MEVNDRYDASIATSTTAQCTMSDFLIDSEFISTEVCTEVPNMDSFIDNGLLHLIIQNFAISILTLLMGCIKNIEQGIILIET